MPTETMTARERILAALRGAPTDRVPCAEVFVGLRAFAEHGADGGIRLQRRLGGTVR
jgi:hypothetical protein